MAIFGSSCLLQHNDCHGQAASLRGKLHKLNCFLWLLGTCQKTLGNCIAQGLLNTLHCTSPGAASTMEMNGSKQHPIVPFTLSTRFKDLVLTLVIYHTTLNNILKFLYIGLVTLVVISKNKRECSINKDFIGTFMISQARGLVILL